MTDEQLMQLCISVMRRTRDSETVGLALEVQSRIATKTMPLPTADTRKAKRRAYMREYMRNKRANPF